MNDEAFLLLRAVIAMLGTTPMLSLQRSQQFWVTADVEHGENNYSVLIDHEENSVGKSADERTPDVLVNFLIGLGVFPEGNQGSLHAAEKLGPQAIALLFVPAVRACQIALGFRADKEAVRLHALALILWTTSSHGEPADGFL